MRRILIRAGLGGVALLVLLAVLIGFALRGSLAMTDGEQALSGLSAPVTVLRDEQGVPRIEADSLQDAVMGLGFVHAQERFFQMDTLRRSAAGELAALFGAPALDFDRERRRWRARHLASEALAELPEAQRELLSAYTEGVNAGLEALSARPPEYWLLRSRPEAWQMEDSLLAGLSMFFYLTDANAIRARRLDQMAAELPDSVLDFLLDPADLRDAPLIEEPLPIPPPVPHREDFDVRGFEHVRLDWRQILGDERPLAGSNNWAVDGQLGTEGRALLAGDMHLGLSLPNTWYRVQLKIDEEEAGAGLNLAGVSLPGAPGLVAGSNGRVAWAFTNSYGDWSTRVRLEMDEDREAHYLSPQGARALEIHEEEIAVKGDDSEIVEYAWTDWGPVEEISDEVHHALVWTGAMPGGINLDFAPLYEASGLDEALLAGAGLGIPPQNMLVADHQGEIGWTIAGRIPQRGNWIRPGQRLPISSEFIDSEGWLAPEDYPRIARPGHGRLWTANSRVASGEDLALVGDGGYALGARQRQIRDRLFEADRFDESDMLAIQLDDEARLLYEWVPLALQAADLAEERADRERFRHEIAHWHGHAWPDSTGYALLRAFRHEVKGRVFGPLLHPVMEAYPDFSFRPFLKRERVVRDLIEHQPHHLLAPRYEGWDELLADAMDAVMEAHEQEASGLPSWGALNAVHIRHPFSDMLPLGAWLDLPETQLPGDNHLPRVQVGSFGASQRMVVSPGQEEEGYFHMPGGQSGHFLSHWYDDGHEDWLEGRPTPFLPGAPRHELRLLPQ